LTPATTDPRRADEHADDSPVVALEPRLAQRTRASRPVQRVPELGFT